MTRISSIIMFTFFSVLLCDRTEQAYVGFDSQRAFEHLKRQCEFGFRIPGSEGHKATKEYLLKSLAQLADTVVTDNFTHTNSTGNVVNLTNFVASFGLDKGKRILLCAHWDTRPFADQETDSRMKDKPILGANDSASGVAVLLEVARVLSEKPASVGVDIVLFDGEDYGKDDSEMYLGSRRFAKINSGYNPLYGILLDMVGDKDLQIYQEENSLLFAPEVVDRVWKTAARIGYGKVFIPLPKYAITDDHIPLIKAGIRCIDVIDFDYPFWHTTQDTIEKCSPGSLEIVGRVILATVYQE